MGRRDCLATKNFFFTSSGAQRWAEREMGNTKKNTATLREDRPVKTRRLYIHEVDMHAQMTKEIHGVGPNGDRWDGIDVIDDWYMGCVRMKSQPGNRARLLRGNTCSGKFGLESGPARSDRTVCIGFRLAERTSAPE